MNILITGGCGFIGSNLAVALRAEGHNVVCFDNLSRRGSEVILHRMVEYGCEFVHGDIRNQEDFNKIKHPCEIMIECSAEPSVMVGSEGSEAMYMIENNLSGAVHCFEYCRKHDMAVLFLSTSRVYPYTVLNRFRYEEHETRFEYSDTHGGISSNGIAVEFPLQGNRSLYGATKLSAEYILQEYSCQYGIPSIINRCGVIAGPWQLGKADQGVFTYWVLNHRSRRPLRYIGFGGKGKQVRDLLHVHDFASLVTRQIKNISAYTGQVFNVGGGTSSNLSLLEATELCRQITGSKLDIVPQESNRPADVLWYITDNRLAEKEFGWSMTKRPPEILSDINNWLSENEHSLKDVFNR